MIIITQEKDAIINFDNVMNIEITDCDEDGFGIFVGVIIGVDDNYRLLGYYKTFERAQKILNELTNTIVLSQRTSALCNETLQLEMLNKMHENENSLMVFSMPKEQENKMSRKGFNFTIEVENVKDDDEQKSEKR